MASPSLSTDLKDERVPSALRWTVDQVAEWIEELGFTYYKACFTTNLINGKRLINLEASAFPCIGITDFEHIKIIAKSIRDLLTLEEPDWSKSISLPPRSSLGLFLEQKSKTGKICDKLTYEQFLRNTEDAKWQPPLANHCLILPHDTPPFEPIECKQ